MSAKDAMEKTVIFVGGTAYSGSTLLDMILANDPRGFSCGEVHAVYHPYRLKHLRLSKLSDVIDWRAAKQLGARKLYDRLFEVFPECHFVVDSSKSPLWISDRLKDLRRTSLHTHVVLIWKYPDEFAASRRKRSRERGWQREWVNYHRYFFTMLSGQPTWRSVRYRDLVTNPETLQKICSWLRIPYFKDKDKYWTKEHATVFGNDTTKIHLHDRDSKEFERHIKAIGKDIGSAPAAHNHHRSISYSPVDTVQSVDNAEIAAIQNVLEYFDVSNQLFSAKSGEEMTSALRKNDVYHAYQVAKQKFGLGWVVDIVRS